MTDNAKSIDHIQQMIKNDTFILHRRDVYLDRITPFLGTPVIKILTGMRRVGKSCLLRMIREKIINAGILPPPRHSR